jgi:hypothetical protein
MKRGKSKMEKENKIINSYNRESRDRARRGGSSTNKINTISARTHENPTLRHQRPT